MGDTRSMFMHTIDGKPATVDRDGIHVVFAAQGRYSRRGARLAPSIAHIRREWKASEAWRAKKGFQPSMWRHGYVRVEVPR